MAFMAPNQQLSTYHSLHIALTAFNAHIALTSSLNSFLTSFLTSATQPASLLPCFPASLLHCYAAKVILTNVLLHLANAMCLQVHSNSHGK